MEYEQRQLSYLEKSEYPMSIKIWDGKGNSTKTLNLDEKCIRVLIDWLIALEV